MNTSIQSEIVRWLIQSNGEPISGQQMADELNLSRTAIWKHMKELEATGFIIETIKKKGYVLQSIPDSVHPAILESYLTTERLGRNSLYVESCPSTQTIAHFEAQNGAVDGTVVLCEEQTAGRGRMARQWNSVKGKGVWMSVIIRPEIPPQQAPQFTLIAAVAVSRAIEELTNCRPSIKWPNDILLNGKKCTGILTELQAEADRVQAIILGIGVNVNQTIEDFPKELQTIATSLKIEDGKSIDRSKFIASVLKHLENYSTIYIEHGFQPLKLLWEGYSNTIGKRIKAVMVNGEIEGLAMGITEDGVLLVKTDDGKTHGIYSADIVIKE